MNTRSRNFADAIFVERIADPLATAGQIATRLGISQLTVTKHEGKPEYRRRMHVLQREKERRAGKPKFDEAGMASKVRERMLEAATDIAKPALWADGAKYAASLGVINAKKGDELNGDVPQVVWLPSAPSRTPVAGWTPDQPIEAEDYVTEAEPMVPDNPGTYRVTFRPHAVQADIASKWFAREARHMSFTAGRRVGKSVFATNVADVECSNADNFTVLFTGPTHKQLRNIYFTSGIVYEVWGHRPDVEIKKEEMLIQFSNGSYIKFAGLDNPGAQEGSGYGLVVIDECGIIRGLTEHIDKSLLPMLFDSGGRMMCLGAPKGSGTDFHDVATREEDWFHVNAGSLHNPFAVPLDELESYRKQVDLNTFKQEALGLWVAHSGQIFAFDRIKHVTDRYSYDPDRPLALSFDFNRAVTSCIVGQQFGNMFVVHASMALTGEWTGPAIQSVCDSEWGKHKGEVKLFGDSSGTAEDSTSGTSDWAIIEAKLKIHFMGQKVRRCWELSNGPVIDSDNAVNCLLDPMDAPTRIAINPAAKDLINDLEKFIWPKDGSRKHAKARAEAKGVGHLCDCFRYWVGNEAPVPTNVWRRKR